MNDSLVTGMILSVGPVNDYDRRCVILTKERGKITVFAQGARRQGSKMMAPTNPFVFGNFKVYETKTAYKLLDVEVMNYFEELRTDPEGAFLGMYFLEFADYYTRENNDEQKMLKLLYQSIRAIIKPTLDNRLVRVIYEMKALSVNGEFPGIPTQKELLDATKYAIEYIVNSSIEKLYTFAVNEAVLSQLKEISDSYMDKYIDRELKSRALLT